MFIFLTAFLIALTAPAAVRCEQVFGERKQVKMTPEDEKMYSDFWESQNYLFNKMGSLFDATPDPRLTKREVGAFSNVMNEHNPRLKNVSIEEIRATRGEWEPLARMHAYEWQIYPETHNRIFENAYTRQIVAIETQSPLESPAGRLIPKDVRERYPKQFLPRSKFSGANKAEQSVDAAVHLAFGALRSLIIRGVGTEAIAPADLKILKQVFFDGPEMKPIRFASEKDMSFSPDPASPHRLILTGDGPGAPIVFNRDRLAEYLNSGKLKIADLAGLVVHELTHHRGLKDDEHRTPDRLGALITKFLNDGGQSKALDAKGDMKIHIYKWGFKAQQFRESFDTDSFTILLEDRGQIHNLTPYVNQVLKGGGNVASQNALFTPRDFDVEVVKTDVTQGSSFELNFNFLVEKSAFDIEKYIRETGLSPENLEKYTPEQLEKWYADGAFANPRYQIGQAPRVGGIEVMFNTDATGQLKLGSLLVAPGYDSPADVSAGGAVLTDLKVVKTENKITQATALLRNFDPPEGYQINLVAKAKGLGDLPLMGPIDRIPVKIDKMTKTPEGMLVEFTVDDSIGIWSNEVVIDSLLVMGRGLQSMLPLGSGVEMKLPPKILRPPVEISAMEAKRDQRSPEKVNFLFQVENLSHLQEAKLFIEVTTLVDMVRFERHLMEIDLMKLNDPKMRDHWNREWLGQLQGIKTKPTQQQFKVDLDVSELHQSFQRVRLHSLFVKDVDLRRHFQLIPGQPYLKGGP